MATAPLIPAQIETVLQSATIAILGLTPGPAAYAKVRVGWQQEGQPAFLITEDVVFLRCVEEDDQYNRVRDVAYSAGAPFQKITNYTRVWRTYWTVYGPNSFDNARKLRTRMFDQDVHDLLGAALLYLVTDPSAPLRVPELFANQWWERVDFSARFNEFVTETLTDQSVKSSEVIVENSGGVIADIVVTAP